VRDLFPINMATQRSRLLGALVHIVQLVDRPDELMPFLRQLGRDHRKFDVIADNYDAVGIALLTALKQHIGEGWTPEVEYAWSTAYGIVSAAMQAAAAAETGPNWWRGVVLEHHRITTDLAVLRVQPHAPVPYLPGNHLSVEVPQRPRLWRHLSPANAPREDGVLEFHVRAVPDGWVSRAIVQHTRPGDVWRLGPPLGSLNFEAGENLADRKLLLIAGGTGFAPLCAVLDDIERRQVKPTVELYFGGRTADDLYGLDGLRMLADAHAWLDVTAVTEDGSVPGGVTGTLAEAVGQRGRWNEHEILVAGSPGMIRSTVARLLASGVKAVQISYDTFS
jgi:NAD(P)H-flavin reductase